MPWLRTGPDNIEVEVPTADLGLLQSEAETARSPAYDVYRFLDTKTFSPAGDRRWDVRLFNERTFGGVLRAPGPIDTLIIGYNAIHLSPSVKAALNAEPPAANLVVLHQLATDSLSFMQGRRALELKPMSVDMTEDAYVPREVSPDLEPLLNWPARVFPGDRHQLTARAVRYLKLAPDSAWQVVLEARVRGDRLPVLVRSTDPWGQRIVVCTLLLEPRAGKRSHSELLENIATYAATGAPTIGVLDPEGTNEADYVAEQYTERLRVQGERAVRVRVPADEPPGFAVWPLRGTQRVVAPASLTLDGAAGKDGGRGEWLKAGRVLVRVGRDGVTTRSDTTDATWAARRWAAWLAAAEPDTWQGSLFAMRAVLRTLEVVREQFGDAMKDVGLHGPGAYERPVRRLLDRRLRGGAVDATIGATVAAWDLDVLVEHRALTIWSRQRIEKWLTDQFETASPEDRFDIARCLADEGLFEDALAELSDESVSATLTVRLREAAAVCRPGKEVPLAASLARAFRAGRVRHELRASPLLAAEFIAAVYGRPGVTAHVTVPGADDDAARAADAATRGAAIVGLTRLRGLAGDHDLAAADPHAISTEAMALVCWLESENGMAFQVRPEAGMLPVSTVEGVLAAALRAREQEEELRAATLPLGHAIHLLGAVTLAALIVCLLAVVRLLGVTFGATDAWVSLAALAACVAALAAYRFVGQKRWSRDRTRTDIALAQSLFGVMLLLMGAGAATAAIRLVERPEEVILAVVAIVALVGAVLAGTRLTPAWLATPLEWALDRKALPRWAIGQFRSRR
jgi:hypothetical protein